MVEADKSVTVLRLELRIYAIAAKCKTKYEWKRKQNVVIRSVQRFPGFWLERGVANLHGRGVLQGICFHNHKNYSERNST